MGAAFFGWCGVQSPLPPFAKGETYREQAYRIRNLRRFAPGLLRNKFNTKSHDGAKQMFSLHFAIQA